jgi:hypothetical protein
VRFALALPRGSYRAEWLNPRTGSVEPLETFQHDRGDRPFQPPPYAEEIALRVKRIEMTAGLLSFDSPLGSVRWRLTRARN